MVVKVEGAGLSDLDFMPKLSSRASKPKPYILRAPLNQKVMVQKL